MFRPHPLICLAALSWAVTSAMAEDSREFARQDDGHSLAKWVEWMSRPNPTISAPADGAQPQAAGAAKPTTLHPTRLRTARAGSHGTVDKVAPERKLAAAKKPVEVAARAAGALREGRSADGGRSVPAREASEIFVLAAPQFASLQDLRGHPMARVSADPLGDGLAFLPEEVTDKAVPLDLADALDALWLGAVDGVVIESREGESVLRDVDGSKAHLLALDPAGHPDLEPMAITRRQLPNLVGETPVSTVKLRGRLQAADLASGRATRHARR